MAFSLDSITKGKQAKAPRIILLGVEKVGKSTFAAGADDCVFIPVKGEEGIDDLDVASFPVATCYDNVLEGIGSLYEGEHEYKTVVIDSASTLEPLVIAHAMQIEGVDAPAKLGGGYGHQDDRPLQLWKQITDGLDALRADRGMASILIGHVEAKPFNDPLTEPYDTYNFDVRKKLRNQMFRWADCILFANNKTLIEKDEGGFSKDRVRAKGTGDRRLYTQKRPAHPGGGRGPYGQLPYELPFNWQAFSDAVANAI